MGLDDMSDVLKSGEHTGKRVIPKDYDIPKVGKVLGHIIWGSQRQYLVDFGSKKVGFFDRSEIKFLPDLIDELVSRNQNQDEFFRLKTWSSILKTENIGTMSLSKMTLDILPHQLEMAHRALETPADGFLMADGVGLGKTIEAGMVIQSMIYRGEVDDVLIISPAKLMRQWKEQMMDKFNTYFAVMGGDYDNHSEDSRAFWRNRSKVIASMETLKLDQHKSKLISSGKEWDLIVVDEAHRLSSYETGPTDTGDVLSYRLLKDLRPTTTFFLFLSATPHQGDKTRFYRLLELLDKDYIKKSPVDDITLKKDKDINDLIARNDKNKVEDREGNLIFKGHETKHKRFLPNSDYIDFLEDLEDFLEKDIDSLMRSGGKGKGFLKSTLLKLANSSPQAIRHTLKSNYSHRNTDVEDERFEGEFEEREALEKIRAVKDRCEEKLDIMISDLEDIESMGRIKVLDEIIKEYIEGKDEKLLIFTEYRKTQEHIKNVLSDRYGRSDVEILHGSMNTTQKYKAIKRFDEQAKFLISTEAGGEGLDMQKNCHIMVNYDIPWNPMRLYQRTGRLDRYGQDKKVLRFDIIAENTIDDKITEYLEEKMDVIKESLSDLEGDAVKGLPEKVLGNVRIDKKEMTRYYLQDNQKSKEMIDDKVDEDIQKNIHGEREILKSLRGIRPEDYTMEETDYGLDSLKDFVLTYLGEHVKNVKEDGDIITFDVPEEVREIGFYQGEDVDRPVWKGTFDREKAQKVNNINLFGFGDYFLDLMIDLNIHRIGEGEVAHIKISTDGSSLPPKKGVLGSFIVRNEVNGKLRFDGVEYSFVEFQDDSKLRLIDNEDIIDQIISKIIEGEYSDKVSSSDDIEENKFKQAIDIMENKIRRKPRGGRLGGTILSSLAWVELG